jgi:citrate synthase
LRGSYPPRTEGEKAIGILTTMFAVMFAIGRLPGWITQWLENVRDPDWKLGRPRQLYVGPTRRPYTPPGRQSRTGNP